MANRLPTDLADLATLPDLIIRAREGFGLEWYELSHGYRSVVLYRHTAGGRFSWSECIAVRGGETYASMVERATEMHRNAA